MTFYDVVREDVDRLFAERERRAEDARVQLLIDAAAPANQPGEEALQQYIARLRCDFDDAREDLDAARSRGFITTVVSFFIGAALGAFGMSLVWVLLIDPVRQ